MSETTPVRRPPPLSPYMNWRWHVTMFTSIAHRATGVALYGGALLLAGWALSLASSRTAYATYMGLLNSIPGKLVLFAITVSVFYHLANGVRHLVWDTGHGLDIKTANLTAWIVIAFSIVASIAFWAVALTMGAV
jgi:succinate dehydrogenase / fumarate reductase cytochrome b subunit